MKRFVLAIMALVLLFAACAIAEEVSEDANIMYVANCGAVTIYSKPDYNSTAKTQIMKNVAVEITGEPVENGWYVFYPVKYSRMGKTFTGYCNADYFAEEREMRNMTGICLEEKGLKVHTEPFKQADLVKKPYLQFGTIPQYAIFEIEYYIGGSWAFLTVEIKGEKEDLGYVMWHDQKTGEQFVYECDPTVTAEWVYNLNWYEIDKWNDLRG